MARTRVWMPAFSISRRRMLHTAFHAVNLQGAAFCVHQIAPKIQHRLSVLVDVPADLRVNLLHFVYLLLLKHLFLQVSAYQHFHRRACNEHGHDW